MGALSGVRTAAGRALLFALLWVVLTGGDGRGRVVAALAVVAAAAASTALRPAPGARWRLGGLAAFVPYFVGQSLLGGIDVSRRALHPRVPLSPAFLDWRCRLPAGPARVCFVAALSLLPGTAGAGLAGDTLRVHVLDDRLPVRASLRALEERVARLFGVALAGDDTRG